MIGDPRLEIEYLTGGDRSSRHPPDITQPGDGGKFDLDGAVLEFPGNTFICHVDRSSVAYSALFRLSAAIQNEPTGKNFTFLPPSSFHMTVFPAICGDPLGHDGWPEGLARRTSLTTLNGLFQERLAAMTAFQTCSMKPIGTFAGTSVILEGSTANDTAKLREARHKLQDLTGLFRPDFETYKFHISLCYRTKWMSVTTAKQHLARTRSFFEDFQQEVCEISLGPIEFCTFSDMHHFESVDIIRSAEET